MLNLEKELAIVSEILKDVNGLFAGNPVNLGPFTEDVNIGGKTFEVTESVVIKLKA